MTGYKTFLVGLLMAVGTPALDYFAHVDWTQYVGGKWAVVASGVVMIAMRWFTTSPMFNKPTT